MARRRIIGQEPPFALRTPDGSLVPARAAVAPTGSPVGLAPGSPAAPGSPTPLQLRLIHVAARQAGVDEAGYRLILKNCGGADSSKQLDQAGFENVLAVFEDRGFREAGQPEDYWRRKVAMRGSFCGSRVEHKVKELAAKQQYGLSGLCRRFSGERTERVDKLTPGEGFALIEALKDIIARGGDAGESPATTPPASSSISG